MRPIRPLVAVVIGFASWLVAPALAQTIPADQSCGGLLCDVGVLGHKVEPAPSPPPPAAPVVVAPAAVAPAPAAVMPREPPRRRAARKLVRPAAAKAAIAPPPVVAVRAPARVAAEPAPAPPPVYTGPTVIFQSIDPRFQLDP